MCLEITYSGKVLPLPLTLPWLKIIRKRGSRVIINEFSKTTFLTKSLAHWISDCHLDYSYILTEERLKSYSAEKVGIWTSGLSDHLNWWSVLSVYVQWLNLSASEELQNYFKQLTRILFLLMTGSLRIAAKRFIASVFWAAAKPDKQQEVKT